MNIVKRKRGGNKLQYGTMFMAYIFRSLEKCKVMVEGLNCEKFLTEIMVSKIYIERIEVKDDTTVIFWCAKAYIEDIQKIGEGKYVVEVLESTGAVPRIKRIFKGRGLAAGIVVIVLMLCVQQFFIVEVEIKGNTGVSEAGIRSVAVDNGLKEYGFRWNYNADQVKSAIFEKYKDVTWVNIAEKGSYALIEIVEGHKITPDTDGDKLHDVIAAKSGYVQEMIVKSGYPAVKEGDYVEAGQVLIKSEVPVNNKTYDPSRDNTFWYTDASGIVKAKVIYKLSFECPAGKYTDYQIKSLAEAKSRQYLRENVPEMLEIINIGLKFYEEKNIIKGVVTLEITEIISIQKENEFAEKFYRNPEQNISDRGQ